MTSTLNRVFVSALKHQRDLVEALLVASFFVVSTRMWYVEEHVVFLTILFSLVVGSLALGLSLIPPLDRSLRSLPVILLLVLGAVMLLSALWSPEFHRTFAYAVFSILQILIGITLARIIKLDSLLAGIFLGSLGVGLYSLAVSLAKGLDPLEGDMLTGLFTNQSDLSFILGMGVATAIPLLGKHWSKTALFGSGAFFLLIYIRHLEYLTTALTLAAVVVVMMGILIVRRAPEANRKKISIGLAAFAGVAITVLWIFRAPLQVALGKTPNFSGRVPIWMRFWGNIQEQPLIGVGWGFTRDELGGTDRIAPHQEIFPAHNGFIEIAFALGIPAAIVLAAGLALAFVVSFADATKVNASWLVVGVPLFVTYLIVHDMAGSWLPRVIGLFLMGAIFGYLAFSEKERKTLAQKASV